MRALLADDHAIVRSGLKRIVGDAFPGAVVGEAATADELRARLREADWSVLVLDIALGERNGLELLPEIRALRPRLPVVILSMHGERPFVVSALRAGVAGYVTKDRAAEELLAAIRSVLAGRRYLCGGVAEQLAEHLAHAPADGGAPHEALSPREFEVLLRLGEGRTVSEIAERLALSVKTVSTYRSRVLEKLALGSNAQLMRYALEHKLVK